jgi:hypothetical protein
MEAEMDLVVVLVCVVAIVGVAYMVGRVTRSDDRDGILTVTLRGWRPPEWPRGVQEEDPVPLHLNLARPGPCPGSACPDGTMPRVSRRNAFPVRVA